VRHNTKMHTIVSTGGMDLRSAAQYVGIKLAPELSRAELVSFEILEKETWYEILVYPKPIPAAKQAQTISFRRKGYTIYRRFDDFQQFANRLCEEFEYDAEYLRQISTCVGAAFGNDFDRNITPEQRMEDMQGFIRQLFCMPSAILEARIVREFFGIWHTDEDRELRVFSSSAAAHQRNRSRSLSELRSMVKTHASNLFHPHRIKSLRSGKSMDLGARSVQDTSRNTSFSTDRADRDLNLEQVPGLPPLPAQEREEHDIGKSKRESHIRKVKSLTQLKARMSMLWCRKFGLKSSESSGGRQRGRSRDMPASPTENTGAFKLQPPDSHAMPRRTPSPPLPPLPDEANVSSSPPSKLPSSSGSKTREKSKDAMTSPPRSPYGLPDDFKLPEINTKMAAESLANLASLFQKKQFNFETTSNIPLPTKPSTRTNSPISEDDSKVKSATDASHRKQGASQEQHTFAPRYHTSTSRSTSPTSEKKPDGFAAQKVSRKPSDDPVYRQTSGTQSPTRSISPPASPRRNPSRLLDRSQHADISHSPPNSQSGSRSAANHSQSTTNSSSAATSALNSAAREAQATAQAMSTKQVPRSASKSPEPRPEVKPEPKVEAENVPVDEPLMF
jgi:hypothetical protein